MRDGAELSGAGPTLPSAAAPANFAVPVVVFSSELDEVKPTFVINAAGITGRPNVDWCEDHKEEVLRTNVIGTMSLMDLTNARGIHMTNFATGCIYSYD